MSAFWLKIYNRLSKLRAVWVPGVVILGLVIAARATGLLQTVEWYALDLFLRSQPKELPDARVVLVGIDEQDIQALGQYPPTDEQLTQMLSAIQRYQPRAIGMNLFRDLPIPPGTAELNTLLESSENIFAIEKVLEPPVSAPVAVPENRVGFTDILLDRDGRQRRLLLGTQTLSGFRFSLALLLAKYYLNEEGITLKNGIQDPTTMRFDSVEFPRLSRNFGGYISLETGTGNVQTILRYRASSAGFPLVSIQDIQNGTVSPDLIRDRIVLLGVTAPSVLDSVSTTATRSQLGPSRNLIYGLEWQAHAVSYILSAVLDGRPTVKTWGEFWEYAWIVGWGCLGIAIAATSRPPKSTILVVAAGVIIICSAGYVSLFWGWWIPFVPAALAFAAETILVGAIYQYDRFTQEKIAAQEQLVSILKHMNSELEARVDSRTAELQAMTVALNQAKESAERASHAKGLFLSRMSHELRTPLNSILGFSQAIASDHTVPEANRDRARAIDSSGEHLLRLINEILDLSKLESGKYAVRETSF
ncbi:MAG: CHASE2 domain-containing protein, partial [Cyanobacteria bacterium P01_H01_bin.15]